MAQRKNSHHNSHDQNDSLLQQDSKVKELREALGPLSGRSAKFCTDACLRRYLEAKNWNVDKAKKMLEETLNWRATYKPEEIRWHDIAHEGETGKTFRANFHDREGRVVLIVRVGKQNTKGVEGNLLHFVYLLENAILNLPEGQEQMIWLIDFSEFSINTYMPVKLAQEMIHVLQNHYPGRLAVAFLCKPPWIFEAFWKVIKYFMNPSTCTNCKFVYPKNKESVELMKSYFDPKNLPKAFGGNASLEYNHEEFSKLMAEDEKKAAQFWEFDD